MNTLCSAKYRKERRKTHANCCLNQMMRDSCGCLFNLLLAHSLTLLVGYFDNIAAVRSFSAAFTHKTNPNNKFYVWLSVNTFFLFPFYPFHIYMYEASFQVHGNYWLLIDRLAISFEYREIKIRGTTTAASATLNSFNSCMNYESFANNIIMK